MCGCDRCNTVHHAASRFSSLHCAAAHCNILENTATALFDDFSSCDKCNTLHHTAICFGTLRRPYCSTLQHHALYRNALLQLCSTNFGRVIGAIQCTLQHCNTLQHTAPHYNTPHHTEVHCNTPPELWWMIFGRAIGATHYSTLQHALAHCTVISQTQGTLQQLCSMIFGRVINATHDNTLQHALAHCTVLQHTATQHTRQKCTATALLNDFWSCDRCNTRHHAATRFSTLHRTAAHCNTMHYTAVHCNSSAQ